MTIAIMLHGGATTVPAEEQQAYLDGCRTALDAGWLILERGGSAFDAVEDAIRVLETDPIFNAGRGGALNADGQVELDAAIMEGNDLNFGSVAVVQGVPHPVSVARQLLDEQERRTLAARGAERFAREHGLEMCAPEDLITERQRAKWEQEQRGQHDTVGCIVRDSTGLMVVGTSTGGLVGAPAGRVGDSPMPGCGFYVDSSVGAAALSGDGEKIAQLVLAKMIVEHLAAGMEPEEAAGAAIEWLGSRVKGEGGCIVLDREGRIGWAHNSSHMPCGYRTSHMDNAVVQLGKQQTARSRERDGQNHP